MGAPLGVYPWGASRRPVDVSIARSGWATTPPMRPFANFSSSAWTFPSPLRSDQENIAGFFQGSPFGSVFSGQADFSASSLRASQELAWPTAATGKATPSRKSQTNTTGLPFVGLLLKVFVMY